jgi:hypothetical protein
MGTIWLEVAGVAFPEKGWYDFMFMVLSGWNYAFTEFLNKQAKQCILSFIDGNIAIRLERVSASVCYTSFGIWDPFDEVFSTNDKLSSYEISTQDFTKELLNINAYVIELTEHQNIRSDDFPPVLKRYKKLQEAVGK